MTTTMISRALSHRSIYHRCEKIVAPIVLAVGRDRFISNRTVGGRTSLLLHSKFSSSAFQRNGTETYKEAMEALRDAERLEEEEEEKKAKEQYDAMIRANKRSEARLVPSRIPEDGKTVPGAVAVIKTIARQLRREKKEENASLSSQELRAKARELMEEAALEHNHPEALVRLGNSSLKEANQSVAQGSMDAARNHVQKAQDFFRLAGESDLAEGWFNLGSLLWEGYPPLADVENADLYLLHPNQAESLEIFQKAVEIGDPDAMVFVGEKFLARTGESRRVGLKYMEQAGELGHGVALHYLSLMHLNGDEDLGVRPNKTKFRTLLDQAADAGDGEALFLRAHCYYHGDEGYSQNFYRALHDFLESAKTGNPDGAISAGAMLHRGEFVPQDQPRAFQLYQDAAELGSTEGWQNVVACYKLGEGVPKCEKTAEYIAKTMLKQ